jgi:hypothetical protein
MFVVDESSSESHKKNLPIAQASTLASLDVSSRWPAWTFGSARYNASQLRSDARRASCYDLLCR